MRDEQTGTWWQQVSGLAIHGPLKGRRLTLVPHDQLTFATWKSEQPEGPRPEDSTRRSSRTRTTSRPTGRTRSATRPTPKVAHAARRAARAAHARGRDHDQRQEQGVAARERDLVGRHDRSGRRRPAAACRVAGRPIVRAFDRRVKGQTLTFVRAGTDAKASALLDLETLSEWDFQGKATQGRTGRQPARPRGATCWTTGSTGSRTTRRRKCSSPGRRREEEGEERDPGAEGAGEKKDEGRMTKDEGQRTQKA